MSSAGRAAINQRNSAQVFEGLVFSNFGPNDLYVTLTYRPDRLPSTRKELIRDFHRFRKRLIASGWAKPVRYIYVPEHKHGEGRWHIHLILSGSGSSLDLTRWSMESIWDYGMADVQHLSFHVDDIMELSRYLTKERPDVGDRGYIPSKGLKRPEIDSRRVPDSTQLSLPPHCISISRDSKSNQYGEFEWRKYLLPEETKNGKN